MFEFQPEHGFVDCLVRIEFPSEAVDGEPPRRFEVQASLLSQHSVVFASMVDGPWKEAHGRVLSVVTFSSDDFACFLRCLALMQAASDSVEVVPTPELALAVIPIATYYQVYPLQDFFVASVRRVLRSPRTDRLDAAVDLALAVERALACTDPVEWDRDVIAGINARLFQLSECSITPEASGGRVCNKIAVRFGNSQCLEYLSRTTLKSCIESLSLHVEQAIHVVNHRDCRLERTQLLFQ